MGAAQRRAVKAHPHFCNTLECPVCVLAFWKWAQTHTNGSPRSSRGPRCRRTFYECAASVDGRTLGEVVKRCGCGLEYDAAGWAALPKVGRMSDGEDGELELANCACGSTIALESPT